MKIYLDTVILNKMVDDLWKFKEDRESFTKISKLKPDSFYVSQTITLQEIKNDPDPVHLNKVLKLYNNMKKISLPPSLSVISGFSNKDMDRIKLREIFTPDENKNPEPRENYVPHFQNKRGKQITADADHIYYAWKSGCDYFLTIDRDSIIEKYHNNKSEVDKIISPMKIVVPPTFLSKITSVN